MFSSVYLKKQKQVLQYDVLVNFLLLWQNIWENIRKKRVCFTISEVSVHGQLLHCLSPVVRQKHGRRAWWRKNSMAARKQKEKNNRRGRDQEDTVPKVMTHSLQPGCTPQVFGVFGTGNWTWDIVLSRQVLCHWVTSLDLHLVPSFS